MSQPIDPLPQILVATNAPETSNRLKKLLESWRYPFVLTEDGTAALRSLTHPQPPGIALIDDNLNSLSGLQLIHTLRHRYQQTQTWLMLLGQQASATNIRMVIEAGADDFLLKPLDESDLQVRLRVAERVQSLTQRIREESAAAHFHSRHDSLTGLLTRESLLHALFRETDRVQRMNTPLGYLLFDLDSFSLVNLNYGYATGDQILKDISQRLKRHLRSYDIAGRYGEDEFLVVLPGCSIENLTHAANRMRQAVLDRPFDIGKDRVTVSASIGIAQSKGRSPLVVLREVERSLAMAKMDGRNCIRNSGQEQEQEPGLATHDANPSLLRISEMSAPNS